MFIKYGDLDVTHRLIEYKSSVAFADGYIIGNVPTMQLNLKFDNYDGILDDLDITKYWEVQENENCEVRYFKVYDQPEKYTKSLSLKLYDNNYELDAPYTTQLSYPVTVKDQLDEIETLTGLSIIRTNIPAYILEKEVSWYDNTIVIRNYLGWIAELFGANVFASGKGSLEFVQVTKDAFAKTDTLTNYEKNELYCVSRIYYENGLNPLEKGDTAGNTIFLDSNNLYLTDEQNLIDKLYDQLNGLTFYSTKSISMISIDNLLPGCLVNYNDEFNFMVTDLSITYKGGEFSISEVDGNTPTKNEERVIKKITNSTRIRKLQITQDQEKLKLDIVAKDIDDTKSEVGQLVISSKDITTQLEKITQSVYLIEAGSGNIFDNCEYSLIKTSEDLERATYSIPSLGITKNYLKGKDIVISLSVYVLNGYLSLGNRVGVEFDVTYKNDVKKTYSLYWYLGQYDLQYLLQTSTNNVDKRIWAHYQLEDEDIVSVSNLRMIVDVNAERAVASNPKVEFGTTPTGFEYDMSTIRDNVQVLITQYAGIETTIETLTAKVEKQEQDTISITTNVDGLKKEMDTIGLNVDSMNERVFTNEDSIQAKIIETQNNYSAIIETIESLTIRTAHTEENVATITQNVSNISSDLTGAKGDISKNAESIGTINSDISSINGNIDTLEEDVSNSKDSLNKITATVNQTVEKYTEIESTVNTLSLKAVDQEEKTTTIEKNVNGAIEKIETVESRVNNTEIALQPKNIVLAVNEQLSKDDAISTTSFTLDNKGAHIKNGALDITNASEEKVFYTDDEGNLTVTGNIVGSKITGSAISFKNIENGQSLELNETGIHIDGIQDTGAGGLGIHFKVLGEEDSFLSIDEYGIEIDGSNASTLGSYGGRLSLSTIMVAGNSPIMYSTSDAVWQGVMSDYVNWLKWVPRSNGEYVEITTVNSTRWGISVWLSDARLKQNIVDTSINALDRVNAIRHVDFDWTNKEGHVKCGYIAQELKQIDDEYVIPIEQDDGSVMYQVCNNTITPLLSKAIQELSAKVDTLERRLEENGISY